MRLHLRLALPLFAVAILVTVAGTIGAMVLVRRTFSAALDQSGRQLAQITDHVLRSRTRGLGTIASELAAGDPGDAVARARRWPGTRLAAAAVVDRATARVTSRFGPALDTPDVAALAKGPLPVPLVLCAGPELLIAGAAASPDGRRLVVAAQRFDLEFARALREFLRADLSVEADGHPVVSTLAGRARADALHPVRVPLSSPCGEAITLVIHLPAQGAYAARRGALAAAGFGGGLLLLVAIGFYWYAVIRVTRPIHQLIAATERIASGDAAAHLPTGAPAELGALVARFNAMGTALQETQARLVHSAKLSSVGALVAGVSHELNNPLLGLLGHAEYLDGKLKAGDPGREELDVILAEGRRMKRILADLRGFVRPGGAERVRVDVNTIATEVLSLVRHEAEKAGVAMEPRLAPGGAPLIASPDLLRQAVLNLAVNALQASSRGGRLTIETAVEGTDVRVTVEDTGDGMPPDLVKRACEPFFTTKPGRMGLGLAICQEVAGKHGGRLEIDSAPGRGARVSLRLPAEPALVAAGTTATPKAAPSAPLERP
ncbi:MAG: ATP-binding protein [Candidatus Coatesbacteria bacterium]